MVPVNAAVTLTVSNPTTPVFGQVRVTKAVSGETQGITAGASFHLVADCGVGAPFPFDLAAGATGSTGRPSRRLDLHHHGDPADRWSGRRLLCLGADARTPDGDADLAGQVVAVTMTNTVVRVLGTVTVTKAPISPAGIVDPARTFSIDYSCTYGNDTPWRAPSLLTAGETATLPSVFLESVCRRRGTGRFTLTAPPSATDPSWVWLPTTYDPSQPVVVSSATTPVAIVVTNSIQAAHRFLQHHEGGRGGGQGRRVDTRHHVRHSPSTCPSGSDANVTLGDGDSFAGGTEPAFTTCTVTEVAVPPPASAGLGWDPVQFTVNGEPAGTGNSVSFDDPGRVACPCRSTSSTRSRPAPAPSSFRS